MSDEVWEAITGIEARQRKDQHTINDLQAQVETLRAALTAIVQALAGQDPAEAVAVAAQALGLDLAWTDPALDDDDAPNPYLLTGAELDRAAERS